MQIKSDPFSMWLTVTNPISHNQISFHVKGSNDRDETLKKRHYIPGSFSPTVNTAFLSYSTERDVGFIRLGWS